MLDVPASLALPGRVRGQVDQLDLSVPLRRDPDPFRQSWATGSSSLASPRCTMSASNVAVNTLASEPVSNTVVA